MSILKKLAGQTAVYGISSVLGRVINFILVPFYTAVLSTAEFGRYTLLYTGVAFLNVVYLYGIETTFFRYSTKENYSKEEAYSLSVSSILVSSLLFSLVIFFLATPIAEFVEIPGKEWYVRLLAVVLFIDSVAAVPFARLRQEEKSKRFAFIKLAVIILTVLLNLFFLVLSHNIYTGEWLSQYQGLVSNWYNPEYQVGYIVISNVIANFFLFILLGRELMKFRFNLNISRLKPMWKYGFPLMLMGLAGMTNQMLDKFLLKAHLPDNFYEDMTSMEAVGVYGACYKLSVFMTLAIQSFRYAAEPFFFSQSKEKNAPETFAQVMKYFIIAAVLILVTVGCNLELFGLILRNPSYRVGLIVVPILLLANLFYGVYFNLSVWFKLTDKTHAGTVTSAIGGVITIIFNLLLIPVLGYVGSAITTFICFFSMALITYFWGQRHYPIPYKIGSAFFYIGLGVVLVLISFIPDYFGWEAKINEILFQMSLVVVYLGVVFLFEKDKLIRSIRS